MYCNLNAAQCAPVDLGCVANVRAQTTNCELLLKILTSPLNLATPISRGGAIIWRFYSVTLTFDPLTLNICCRPAVTYWSY